MKRTVVHKIVLRDPVSKRMVAVKEITECFEGIVCRAPDGTLFEMPEIEPPKTYSVSKSAAPDLTSEDMADLNFSAEDIAAKQAEERDA